MGDVDYRLLDAVKSGEEAKKRESNNGLHAQKYAEFRTVEFAKILLSFRWARRCGGFVGNFDSNVSGLIYMLMCHFHKDCPPKHSFGGKDVKLTWG